MIPGTMPMESAQGMSLMSRIAVIGRAFICCAMLAAVAGCASPHPTGARALNVVPGTAAGMDSSYRLQIGDSITFHFLPFPDLDDTATVGPDGHIALRYIGDFPIAGMTLAEATKATNDRYETVLRHPDVSIVIKNYALQQVFIDGEVNNPGVIRSPVPLTASGAIAQAGGLKLATARAGGALLLRRGPDGAVVYYKLSFHGDLPGGEGDPILRTNDLIYVPRTAIASVADFVQANLTRVIPLSASFSVYHNF